MTSPTPPVRNPKAEAASIVGPDAFPVVLEPSPPTVTEGPWFADDPVDTATATAPTIVPDGLNGDQTWSQWLDNNPDHRSWVESRWLGGDRRLPPAPPAETLARTRVSLHRLAAYVVAPTRYQANTKFGLRWTMNGFGTPFFGADRQVRVVGPNLVDQQGQQARHQPITSLNEAARFLGTTIDSDTAAEHDTPPPGDIHRHLVVDTEAIVFISSWFGLATAALEVLRADPSSVDPSRPQIWPGHFDAAIETGDEDHRATYGASCGDNAITEPYLYVSVWWPDRIGLDTEDKAWITPTFTGRALPLSQLDTDNPVQAAVQFWTATRDELATYRN